MLLCIELALKKERGKNKKAKGEKEKEGDRKRKEGTHGRMSVSDFIWATEGSGIEAGKFK